MGSLISQKLKSTSGESIAETLVAVLISAFALLMLAGILNSSSNIITKSMDALKTYYGNNNSVAEQSAGSAGSVSFTSTDDADEGLFTNAEVPVTIYKNNETGTLSAGIPIVSYSLRATDTEEP